MLTENEELYNSGMLEYAGKVNFNAASQNGYLTNENYKTLRTNILFCGTDIKTIVLTSARENEGKSTVSAELAKSLAEAGKKTVFIDADMRKSVLMRRSAASRGFCGLSEYLSGQAELSDVIYNTQIQNFDVIFSGRFPPNPVELLGSQSFVKLIDMLKSVYDYVIIDSPPLGAIIDAAVIASYCDGAIIVITPGKIPYTECLEVKEQLSKSGCKILGAVLNDIYGKRTKYYKKYYRQREYSKEANKIKYR